MEFLSTTWSLLRDRPKEFVRGSKHSSSKRDVPAPISIAQDPVVSYPSIVINADLSTVSLAPTSQWSPVSATFEHRPHLLVKRSKSFKSAFTRRSRFHAVDKEPSVAENPSLDSLPSNDRKSNLLNVVIVPLTRRKSKTSTHKMADASPTYSDASSFSSHSSKKYSHLTLRRTASQSSVRHPREYFDHSTPNLPLPDPLIPPVPNLPPGFTSKPGRKLQARRPRTADPASTLIQHPLPTRPIIADVEGYWDHLELLNIHRGRDHPFPLPRKPHHSPVPF